MEKKKKRWIEVVWPLGVIHVLVIAYLFLLFIDIS